MPAFNYNRAAIAADLRRRGSPMKVEDFEVAAKYGVNPAFAWAIALKESEGGKTGYATRGTYNPYGWGIYQGKRYPTWRAATEAMAKGLSGSLYKGAGLVTPEKIFARYAPSSDGNDPAGYAKFVRQMMQKAGAGSQFFGDSDPTAGAGGDPRAAARALIGDTASPEQAAQNEKSALAGAVAGAIVRRPKGQSLFDAVTGAVVQSAMSAVGQPSISEKKGVNANPVGYGPAGAPGEAEPVAAAKRYLGTPYSWGGGSPSGPTRGFGRGAGTVGFDCSSLVQMAWSKAGVKLPRVTYQQIKVGRAINPKNMGSWAPGDLVFPHSGHVQMYIGNGKVIEAPRTGGHVQIVPVRSSNIAVRRPRG